MVTKLCKRQSTCRGPSGLPAPPDEAPRPRGRSYYSLHLAQLNVTGLRPTPSATKIVLSTHGGSSAIMPLQLRIACIINVSPFAQAALLAQRAQPSLGLSQHLRAPISCGLVHVLAEFVSNFKSNLVTSHGWPLLQRAHCQSETRSTERKIKRSAHRPVVNGKRDAGGSNAGKRTDVAIHGQSARARHAPLWLRSPLGVDPSPS